jgi:molybdopterin converting factor subunit 1
MQLTVRFFASLRETTGESHCALDVPEGMTLQEAVARLMQRYPTLRGHEASWHFAVNQTHAEPEAILHSGDVISIFPYIAGG